MLGADPVFNSDSPLEIVFEIHKFKASLFYGG